MAVKTLAMEYNKRTVELAKFLNTNIFELVVELLALVSELLKPNSGILESGSFS